MQVDLNTKTVKMKEMQSVQKEHFILNQSGWRNIAGGSRKWKIPLEENLALSCKISYAFTLWPSNLNAKYSFQRYIAKNVKIYIYTRLSTETLYITIGKAGNGPKCLSIGNWLKTCGSEKRSPTQEKKMSEKYLCITLWSNHRLCGLEKKKQEGENSADGIFFNLGKGK